VRRAALVVGIGCTLVASAAAAVAAEPDVYVGGYHDEALRAAQNEWLGLGVGLADSTPADPALLAVQTDGEAGLTAFTPRFGGLGQGIVGSPHHPALDGDARAAGPARQVGVGLNDTSRIAGVDVNWSAKAGVSHEPPAQAGEPSTFAVGGELAVSGVRFDAAYGERATVLGVSGNHMTAGLAYGIGGVDTRVSYSLVTADDETAASLLSVGSRLMLQPGLILQGDLAYAQEKDTGAAATAGVVSLRFNF
jgi:hypothetical protein